MTPDPLWLAPPHTIAKQRIIRAYLDAWLPIMQHGSYGQTKRLVIIDGFAGPGEYKNGEPGSPLQSLRAALEHKDLSNWPLEMVYLFIEQDDANRRHLEQVAIPKLGRLPDKVKVVIRPGTFEDNMTSMFGNFDKSGNRLAPTFAIVDPFGFKGIPMRLIARILAEPQSEVMITVMAGYLNRFATHPDPAILEHYDALFGSTDWRRLTGETNRLDALSAFYGESLGKHAKFTWSFRMLDAKGVPVYDLWYGTNHMRGLEVMKDALWKVDPEAGTKFSDREDSGQLPLFDPPSATAIARQRFIETFAGETVAIEDIHVFFMTRTSVRKGGYKREVLGALEKEDRIRFIPTKPGAKHAIGQYPAGSRLMVPRA